MNSTDLLVVSRIHEILHGKHPEKLIQSIIVSWDLLNTDDMLGLVLDTHTPCY